MAGGSKTDQAILKENPDGSLGFNRKQVAATYAVTGHDEWTERIRKAYPQDAVVQDWIHKDRPLDCKVTEDKEGTFLYEGLVYVPTILRNELITDFHSTPVHGHQGINKT